MPCPKLNITDFFRFAETEKIINHEVTDLCFAPQKINEYSPFGKTTLATGTITNNKGENIVNRFNFRFSSEYQDNETGLVYYNFRYYSPELGRWLSRDPIGEWGGYNLYAMVGNAPVNWWDWRGLKQSWEGTTFDIFGDRVLASIRFDADSDEPCCEDIKMIQVVRFTHDGKPAINELPEDDIRRKISDEKGYFVDMNSDSSGENEYYQDNRNFIDKLIGNIFFIENSGSTTGFFFGLISDPARMLDMPGAPTKEEWNMKFEFETCAVCAEGKNEGHVYSCITWSFTIGKNGKIDKVNKNLTGSKKSNNFDSAREALKKWQKENLKK